MGRETYRSTTAQRADMQPKLQQTPLTRTTHLAGADSPKTQTTSPLAARCQRFSPRWSAVRAPHHRKPRPRRRQSGGIALHGGPTRWRHAARRLRVVQNPPPTPMWGCRGTAKYGGGAARRWRGRGSVGPGTVPGTVEGQQTRQNSPGTAPPPLNPRQNSPSNLKTSNLGGFERAGRTFSRTTPPPPMHGAPESPNGLAAVPVGGARALP